MELGHNRVWDYVGDNFVHRYNWKLIWLYAPEQDGDGGGVVGPIIWLYTPARLVQNTSDGKLVEQEAGEKVGQEHVGGVQVNSGIKIHIISCRYFQTLVQLFLHLCVLFCISKLV